MDDDKLLTGLKATDALNEILYLMRESVKTAREPIDRGDWDVVTVRGELTDIREYLDMALRENDAIRSSFVDLIALIRRLQTSYHQAYAAVEEAEQEMADAFHAGEVAMLGRFIRDSNDEMMSLFVEIAHILNPLTPAERTSLCQELQCRLKRA